MKSGNGRVFTREQLLSRVGGYRQTGNTRPLDIHVRRLRAKLGDALDMIETVRHVGEKCAHSRRGADANRARPQTNFRRS